MVFEAVLEQDWQHWHSRYEGACPEVENAAIVSTGALGSHHQHGESAVIDPAGPTCKGEI